MKKIILITITLLVLVASGTFLILRNDNQSDQTSPTLTTASVDPAEYKKCVEAGGQTSTQIRPAQCVIGNKAYYDGNF